MLMKSRKFSRKYSCSSSSWSPAVDVRLPFSSKFPFESSPSRPPEPTRERLTALPMPTQIKEARTYANDESLDSPFGPGDVCGVLKRVHFREEDHQVGNEDQKAPLERSL